MNTYRRNTKILFTVLAMLILMMFTIIGYVAGQPIKAEPNTVTNFYCEIAGEWSNHHFDIRSATTYGTEGMWRITYRDSGESTIYLQRRGEDCRVITLPTPAK